MSAPVLSGLPALAHPRLSWQPVGKPQLPPPQFAAAM